MKKKQKKQNKKVKKVSNLKVHGNLQLLPPAPAVEITRSFSYKLNVGNYESRDFFCSQKSYAKPEDAEAVSKNLYDFCKREVMKSVNQFRNPDTTKSRDAARDVAEQETQEI